MARNSCVSRPTHAINAGPLAERSDVPSIMNALRWSYPQGGHMAPTTTPLAVDGHGPASYGLPWHRDTAVTVPGEAPAMAPAAHTQTRALAARHDPLEGRGHRRVQTGRLREPHGT